MTSLVFWQNCVSIHQAPMLRVLSSIPTVDVTVVAETDIPQWRKSMGWSGVDYGHSKLVIAPDPSARKALLQECRDADAHIFSGLGSYSGTTSSFRELIAGRRKHVSILTESWDPRGLKGVLTKQKYRWLVSRYSGSIDSILTIGPLAQMQFRGAGIRADKVWPFGYFVDRPDTAKISAVGRPFTVLFVGSMVALKRPLMLLRSMAQLPEQDWHLRYVGEGPEVQAVRQRTEETGLAERVSFSSFLSNDGVRQQIADCDLLVLPSSYDGWGVVVNEALQVGTRVAVSSAAGASELVREDLQGWTFSAQRQSELTDVIRQAMTRRGEDRERLMEWSERVISPKAAAHYLLRIVRDHGSDDDVDSAPWLT